MHRNARCLACHRQLVKKPARVVKLDVPFCHDIGDGVHASRRLLSRHARELREFVGQFLCDFARNRKASVEVRDGFRYHRDIIADAVPQRLPDILLKLLESVPRRARPLDKHRPRLIELFADLVNHRPDSDYSARDKPA